MEVNARQIWNNLVYTQSTESLDRVATKQEVVFNQIILLGIVYLLIVFAVTLSIAVFVNWYYEESYAAAQVVYPSVTLFFTVFLVVLYVLNRRKRSLILKTIGYLVAHIYIIVLCLFAGKEAGIEIIIFGIIPFTYFVVGNETKVLILKGFAMNVSSLFIIHYFYYTIKPMYPLPDVISTNLIYLASAFNVAIISIFCYRFYQETQKIEAKLEKEQERSEALLLNIFPKGIAEELKESGSAKPQAHKYVSVLFTDFVGFTKVAQKMSAEELVRELDFCFKHFDTIIDKYKLEKLKTIGDSYMCAGGIPTTNYAHAIDCVLAGLEIRYIMNKIKRLRKKKHENYWELRVGINTGPIVAGVIGNKKYAYDIWGDTVNTASRMESSGEPGKINISEDTYQFVKDFFDCRPRGKLFAKNKGWIEMYFVEAIKKELSFNGRGRRPNDTFYKMYEYEKAKFQKLST